MVNFVSGLLLAVEDYVWTAVAVEILESTTGLAGFFMYRMYVMPHGTMDGGVVEFNELVSFIILGTSLQFILFSRSNCPLCEAMEDELRPFIEKYKITVQRQYIDNEPELERIYGDRVPVLSTDGKILCEYFLDPDALLSRIENAAN